jgi:hypothetical protein
MPKNLSAYFESKVDVPGIEVGKTQTLEETADQVLKECSNVSAVYYDVTP